MIAKQQKTNKTESINGRNWERQFYKVTIFSFYKNRFIRIRASDMTLRNFRIAGNVKSDKEIILPGKNAAQNNLH